MELGAWKVINQTNATVTEVMNIGRIIIIKNTSVDNNGNIVSESMTSVDRFDFYDNKFFGGKND